MGQCQKHLAFEVLFCTVMMQCDKLPGKGLGRKVDNVMTSSPMMSLGLPFTAASEPFHPSVVLSFFKESLETSSPFLGKQDVTCIKQGTQCVAATVGVTHLAPPRVTAPTKRANFWHSALLQEQGVALTPTAKASPLERGGDPQKECTALLRPVHHAKESCLKRIKFP